VQTLPLSTLDENDPASDEESLSYIALRCLAARFVSALTALTIGSSGIVQARGVYKAV